MASWPEWKRQATKEALINSPYTKEARQRMANVKHIIAVNPESGLTEPAILRSDYFGEGKAGVQFETTTKIYHFEGVIQIEDEATQSTPMPESDYAGLETRVLDAMCKRIHADNVAAGWWDQADNPLVVPVKLFMAVSECCEAMEGDRRTLMDDKLTDEKMIAVELADVLIRVFDLCGFLGVNVGTLLAKKAAFNATREDHKPENRAKKGGKKY